MEEIQQCTTCNIDLNVYHDAFYPLCGEYIDGEYIATDDEDKPFCSECADKILNNNQ